MFSSNFHFDAKHQMRLRKKPTLRLTRLLPFTRNNKSKENYQQSMKSKWSKPPNAILTTLVVTTCLLHFYFDRTTSGTVKILFTVKSMWFFFVSFSLVDSKHASHIPFRILFEKLRNRNTQTQILIPMSYRLKNMLKDIRDRVRMTFAFG